MYRSCVDVFSIYTPLLRKVLEEVSTAGHQHQGLEMPWVDEEISPSVQVYQKNNRNSVGVIPVGKKIFKSRALLHHLCKVDAGEVRSAQPYHI
jgi:hypothetical protein